MRLILGGIDWHSYSQLILRPYGERNFEVAILINQD